MCTLNGQFRPITVRDRSVEADVKAAEKADPARAGHVPAPFAGVVTPAVAEGDTVEAGGVVATIEAMKMEANITAPVGGTVERLAIGGHQQVEGGDLLLVMQGGSPGRKHPSASRRRKDCIGQEQLLRTTKEITMGVGDKMENMKDDLAGKAKEAAGKATDNERLEAEGRVDQSKADIKQAGEKVKDAFKN